MTRPIHRNVEGDLAAASRYRWMEARRGWRRRVDSQRCPTHRTETAGTARPSAAKLACGAVGGRSHAKCATTRTPNSPLCSETRLWRRMGVMCIGPIRVVEKVDHTGLLRYRDERVKAIRAVKSEQEFHARPLTHHPR